MKEIMLADTPIEQRGAIIKDSCDQIVERSYTRKFGSEETNERRAELAEVAIQVNDLEEELASIRAEYKAKIKPLCERIASIRNELKAGGEWVKGDCFLFIDREENRAGLYAPDGSLIEERPLTKEERQKSIMEVIRTGTHD